jgi:hypothetical protein
LCTSMSNHPAGGTASGSLSETAGHLMALSMCDLECQARGALCLPLGRLARARSLRRALPDGPRPEFGVYLSGGRPAETQGEAQWVRWPDFWLPTGRTAARKTLYDAWQRAEVDRVEIAAPVDAAAPAPRSPVLPSSTVWPRARRSRSSASATTGGR